MNIFGLPSASLDRVNSNLRSLVTHTRFINEMVPALWNAAENHGIDSVVMVAQAMKETGSGNYAGKVPATFFNTCGLKIRDPSLAGADQDATMAHAQFASWWLGANAHAQHLIAYGQYNLPDGEPLFDPRWVWVRKAGAIQVLTVEALGGKWAPSLTYGTEIVAICNKLKG